MKLKNLIKHLVFKLGFSFTRVGNTDFLYSLIYRNHHKDFFFIQIGANDGVRFDPIHEIVTVLKLKGLALEPINEYFSELAITYKNTNVLPINKALYSSITTIPMYKASKSAYTKSECSKGIASLNPDHHLKSGVESTEIIEEMVSTITFDALIDEYQITKVDLLQIDTEGYDYDIIKMIPFDKIKPSIIIFEHGICDQVMSPGQLSELISLLVTKGYQLHVNEYDCIAFQ